LPAPDACGLVSLVLNERPEPVSLAFNPEHLPRHESAGSNPQLAIEISGDFRHR